MSNPLPEPLCIHDDGRVRTLVIDEPGDGGASHKYIVYKTSGEHITTIKFQEGPIQESGTNGLTNESLLSIVENRLKGFQSGQFACPENQKALEAVSSALSALSKRTQDRKKRGVEGTHIK